MVTDAAPRARIKNGSHHPFIPALGPDAVSFSAVAADLQAALKKDMAQIRYLMQKSPAAAYAAINEKGRAVGAAHGMTVVVNFPHEGKITEYAKYGTRDLSLIIDKERTRFPVPRERIKKEATRIPGATTEDAYMYEGKEGVRVRMPGGRIDVLPHSLHVWCEFEPRVLEFCDWLLREVYEL